MLFDRNRVHASHKWLSNTIPYALESDPFEYHVITLGKRSTIRHLLKHSNIYLHPTVHSVTNNL